MLDALVFGGSGQVGMPLLERLRDAGWRVFAVSRGRHADLPGVQWLQGDLERCDGLICPTMAQPAPRTSEMNCCARLVFPMPDGPWTCTTRGWPRATSSRYRCSCSRAS